MRRAPWSALGLSDEDPEKPKIAIVNSSSRLASSCFSHLDEIVVITDGQMSGLVNGGLAVAEVSPEGAAGGPLGLVRDGDMISIDVAGSPGRIVNDIANS
jgi:dihydroxyacid dehydratase/phosphogluconate dehydratase